MSSADADMGLVEEARADIQQWREEDGVLETVVKLVEMLVGFGIIARAACHVFGHLADHGVEGDEYPEITWRLTRATAVDSHVGLRTEFFMRACAANYGIFWTVMILPLDVSAGSPAANAVFQALVWLNVLVLVVDPVFLGQPRE